MLRPVPISRQHRRSEYRSQCLRHESRKKKAVVLTRLQLEIPLSGSVACHLRRTGDATDHSINYSMVANVPSQSDSRGPKMVAPHTKRFSSLKGLALHPCQHLKATNRKTRRRRTSHGKRERQTERARTEEGNQKHSQLRQQMRLILDWETSTVSRCRMLNVAHQRNTGGAESHPQRKLYTWCPNQPNRVRKRHTLTQGTQSTRPQEKKSHQAPTHLRWLLHHSLQVAHQPQPGGSRRAAHDGAHTLAHLPNTGRVDERTRASTQEKSTGSATAGGRRAAPTG